MGTNYYVETNDTTPNGIECEKLHIGKSSMGWVFSLRVYPERGINSLYDWMPIILDNQNVIRDEYGHNITAAEMLRTIAVRGPNNLGRDREVSEYGRTHTHGEGTWDYCDYDFF